MTMFTAGCLVAFIFGVVLGAAIIGLIACTDTRHKREAHRASALSDQLGRIHRENGSLRRNNGILRKESGFVREQNTQLARQVVRHRETQRASAKAMRSQFRTLRRHMEGLTGLARGNVPRLRLNEDCSISPHHTVCGRSHLPGFEPPTDSTASHTQQTALFGSFRDLIDVAWLNRCTVVVFGCGRVGLNVLKNLVSTGIGELVVIDHDRVEARNIPFGFPASSIGRYKVTVAEELLTEMNPALKYRAIRRKITPEDAGSFFEEFSVAHCAGFFIDDFDAVAPLVIHSYDLCPCVAAVQLGGVGVGDIAFSYAYHTPCLECSMRLSERSAGAGAQTLAGSIGMLAETAANYIIGLCLLGHRGIEHYAPLLDPGRCRGFLVQHPNGFLSNPRSDFACSYQLIDVVSTDWHPGCSVCELDWSASKGDDG